MNNLLRLPSAILQSTPDSLVVSGVDREEAGD